MEGTVDTAVTAEVMKSGMSTIAEERKSKKAGAPLDENQHEDHSHEENKL